MRRALLAGVLALALIALSLPGCRKKIEAPMPGEGCLEWIEDRFGPQRFYVVALHPMAGNTIFTPEHLDTIDLVTARLEDAQTDYVLAVRSITTAPLIVPSPTGLEIERIRDNLPVDLPNAHRYQGILMSYEFAVGDSLDAVGSTTFIHLPRDNYAGVDLDAVVDGIRAEIADKMMIAIHGTPDADPSLYRDVASRGPGADSAWVVLSGEDKGAVKTPMFLRGLQMLQVRLETLPTVSSTYGVAEDVMLARRATHKGDPAAFLLPAKQAEINQLLMMFQLSGNAADYGERITTDGRTTLLRLQMPVMKDGPRARAVRQIERYVREGFPVGVSAAVCAE